MTNVPVVALLQTLTRPPDFPDTEDGVVRRRSDTAVLLDVATRPQGATMEAAVGDRIVVAAAMLSGPLRDGEIIQVGKQGEPPYLVRWSDDGRETLFFPRPRCTYQSSS
jgi:Domain of unknown function (DUF1918)